MELYFVSQNQNKYNEIVKIMGDSAKISLYEAGMEEIQDESITEIAKHKALDAYKKLLRPVFVEHSGLKISSFGDLPGGFTQIFWDKLGADAFCNYFHGCGEVTAVSVIAFCDGKRIHTFSGEMKGFIVERPRGKNGYSWDCVFQPQDDGTTFSEMADGGTSEKKMRIYAVEQFKNYLKENKYV